MADRNTTLTSKWWETVDQFLGRSDFVLSCELALREDLATVGSTGRLIGSLVEGQPTVWNIEISHPSESQVEQAAARVRPLFLQEDRVHHGKVTTALGGLAQGAPQQHREIIKLAKKAWQQNETGYRWSMGTTRNGGSGEMRNDRQIAHYFLYGYLAHHDVDARERLRGVPEAERLIAATVWAADAIKLTLATRQLIIDLRDGGYLSPRPSLQRGF